jgi:hypothetical protein
MAAAQNTDLLDDAVGNRDVILSGADTLGDISKGLGHKTHPPDM